MKEQEFKSLISKEQFEAIKKAFDNVDVDISLKKVNKVYEDVLCYIKNNYATRKTINVEDIQDIIETKLKENKKIIILNKN